MQGPFLRKYGVEATINFCLYEIDGIDLRIDAASATGDINIQRDEAGSEQLDADAFVDRGQSYSLVLSIEEMTAARIAVHVVDQTSPKAWLDEVLIVETYGNAAAQHAFDLDTAKPVAASVDGAVGSVTGAVGSVAANGITATSLAADAINAASIKTGAFTADAFAADAIVAATLATGVLTADAFAADAIVAATLATGVLTADAFAADAIVAATLATGALTADAFAANALINDAFAASAVTKIQNGLATPTNITAGTITTVTEVTAVAANGITATSLASDAINAASLKADAVTAIQSGLATPTNITAGTITTVTTLTGHTAQSGDSYAIVNSGVFGNEAILNRGNIAWLTGSGASGTESITTSDWTRTIGDDDGGAGTDTEIFNGTTYDTGEVNSGTFIEVVAVFTLSEGHIGRTLDFWGFYDGSTSHWMEVFAENVGDSTFELLGTISEGDDVGKHLFGLSPNQTDATIPAAPVVTIKFRHNQGITGITSHVFSVDKCQVNTAAPYSNDVNVTSMAANVLTASALATDAVTEIVTGLKTSTGFTAGATTTFAEAVKILLAGVAGDVSFSTPTYTVKDIDDASSVYTYTVAASGTVKNGTIT